MIVPSLAGRISVELKLFARRGACSAKPLAHPMFPPLRAPRLALHSQPTHKSRIRPGGRGVQQVFLDHLYLVMITNRLFSQQQEQQQRVEYQ